MSAITLTQTLLAGVETRIQAGSFERLTLKEASGDVIIKGQGEGEVPLSQGDRLNEPRQQPMIISSIDQTVVMILNAKVDQQPTNRTEVGVPDDDIEALQQITLNTQAKADLRAAVAGGAVDAAAALKEKTLAPATVTSLKEKTLAPATITSLKEKTLAPATVTSLKTKDLSAGTIAELAGQIRERSVPNTLVSPPDITLEDGTATLIAAGNASRVSLLLVNRGPGAIRYGGAGVTVNSGGYLPPNAQVGIEGVAAVYAIRTDANEPVLNILEGRRT